MFNLFFKSANNFYYDFLTLKLLLKLSCEHSSCYIQFLFSFLKTSSRLLQWLVFRQTTEITLYVQFFSTDINRFRGNPAIAGSSSCFSQKLFRAFAKPDEDFRHLETFSKLFACLQRDPLTFCEIFCNKLELKKPKGIPFYVFRHYETVSHLSSEIRLKEFFNKFSINALKEFFHYYPKF